MLKVNDGRCEASGTPVEIIADVCVAVEAVVKTLISIKKDSASREGILFGVIGAVIHSMNANGEKIDQAKIGLALIAQAGKAGRKNE